KECVTFDDGAGLRVILADADVVIEVFRPRALVALGIDPVAVARAGRLRVWLSLTGHGRASDRVAFGDDAAVAGGLVAWALRGPCFRADAVADPPRGLPAAASVLAHLEAGGRWLLDIALARTAAHLARRPASHRPWTGPVAPPRVRRP